MYDAVKRTTLWMIAVGSFLPIGQATAEETERESVGKLTYLDSISRPFLQAANCATVSSDGKFLYVSAWQAKSIVVMRRDESTGALEHLQTITSDRDLDGVTHVCLSPDEKLAMGSAFRSQTAVLFERDSTTGMLRLLDAAREGEKAVKGLSWSVSGTFSPDSRFLYVCDPKTAGKSSAAQEGQKGAITGFLVTRNRKLKWIETNHGQDNCFDGARSVVFHPSRKLAFVASTTANALVVLDWHEKTGKLTIRQIIYDGKGNATALAGAMDLAWSPDGRFVYVSSGRFKGDNAISVFRLTDENNLVWVEEFISESSALRSFSGGNELCVSPDGRNVYAAASTSHALACFERDVDSGRLQYIETLKNDATLGQLSGAAGVAISPDGKYVYVTAEYSDGVATFERQHTP